MSQQAKLGIGLGVGLGVPFLGAVAAALFLWRRSLLAQAQNNHPDGGDDDSPDEMSKVTHSGYAPVPGPGSEAFSGSGSVPAYGHAQDGAAGAAAVGSEPGTPGVGAELGNTGPNGTHVHQLEGQSNMRAELGDRGVYELQ